VTERPPFPEQAFRRYDESPDDRFYASTRLVTHIDDAAITAVTQLYREYVPAGGAFLDLMSSWVSHLPAEVHYGLVVGLGMNREELEANPRLDDGIVQDLNRDPRLPFADETFDAAGICVSIQYLTQPAAVLREVGRVLKPGGPIVITYSNRCFPTKAVAIWQALDDRSHCALIERYLLDAGNWGDITWLDRSPGGGDPLYAVVARSTGAMPPAPTQPAQ
jgi:SAM-dependent methyltransferase